MPNHTSWLHYVLHYFEEVLSHNAHYIGNTFYADTPPTWRSFEPIGGAIGICIVIVLVSLMVRGRIARGVEPDSRFTLPTAVEVFLSYFYDLAKSVMGPERARKYYTFIGASACFVFLSNVVALIPGFPVPTSSLNITAGSAIVIFVVFNVVGIRANGGAYFKHMAGPAWYLYWLIFPIELVSLCVRPITLAVRLMLNMSVDHLLLTIFVGFTAILLPLPVMALGVIVILVQTLVFALLTTVYIGLATEDMRHH